MAATAGAGGPRQVVSLGAGFDTTWMHLKVRPLHDDSIVTKNA